MAEGEAVGYRNPHLLNIHKTQLQNHVYALLITNSLTLTQSRVHTNHYCLPCYDHDVHEEAAPNHASPCVCVCVCGRVASQGRKELVGGLLHVSLGGVRLLDRRLHILNVHYSLPQNHTSTINSSRPPRMMAAYTNHYCLSTFSGDKLPANIKPLACITH